MKGCSAGLGKDVVLGDLGLYLHLHVVMVMILGLEHLDVVNSPHGDTAVVPVKQQIIQRQRKQQKIS